MPIKNDVVNIALSYQARGFTIIPLLEQEKRSRHKWSEWENGATEQQIISYYQQHPGDSVGCIPGKHLVVYDADTPESLAKLYEIEEACYCHPNLIAKTQKGEHHYFSVPDNVEVRQRSFNSKTHPACIDIKTGRCLVQMPPSGGKTWELTEAFDE